ncbi:MAG: histidine kinase [Usitatibacter sp.]
MAAIAQFFARPQALQEGASRSMDARMVAFMRCVLAISGLAIIYVDPTEPARYVALTYVSLSAYCLWSLALLASANGSSLRQSPWIDVLWATYLVALTQGTSSIFFFLFLFAILVASFSEGYRAGFTVALASTLLFCAVGLAFAPEGEGFELNRSLIRPVYLLAMGWMMAVWGGREMVLRRRLALLRDIANEWNPRLGVARTVHANLERVLAFFAARECLLVIRRRIGGDDKFMLYKVAAGAEGLAKTVTEMEAGVAAPLLKLPADASIAYDARHSASSPADAHALAHLLDAGTYASVPYTQNDGSYGRLFVVRGEAVFAVTDIQFLEQLALSVSHAVENTQLIDELVLKAGEHERFRISLDIHDSTVQPYIGLKLGLDALYRAAESNPLQRRVGELLDMADMTIRDLRGFATGVRQRAPMSGESLVKAIREQADRFHRFYGIEIQVECDEILFVSPQLASEAFRMVSEGLSNVVRHTSARRAFVRLSRAEKELRLVIANEPWTKGGNPAEFTPASINARAGSLGGHIFVERGADGSTAVHVTIPV